jgi:type IV secretory pathway VirD2 relaxase
MPLIEPELYEAKYGYIKGRASRITNLDAKTRRVARGATEVLVKRSGYGHGVERVHAHLTYITRHGKWEMENDRGEVFHGRDELNVFFKDWKESIENHPRRASFVDKDGKERRQRDILQLVLSMPEYVDSESVRNATREFAREVFGKNHEYVFALHTNEPHPHCHLAVKCRGHDGRQLHTSRTDLHDWREIFAKKLREQGVDAEATPRFTRGVVRKAERNVIRHMARGDKTHPPRVPEVVTAKRKEIFKELMEEIGNDVAAPLKAWEEAIKSRQNSVRRGWLSAAQALEQASVDPPSADKEFSETIRRFVSAMPSIDTERHLMKRELIQELTQKPEKHLTASNEHAEIRHSEADRASGRSGVHVETARGPSYGQIGAEQFVRSGDKDLER